MHTIRYLEMLPVHPDKDLWFLMIMHFRALDFHETRGKLGLTLLFLFTCSFFAYSEKLRACH